MLVTFAASFVALFAVAGELYVFQLRNFRQTYERELRTLSRITADNCAAALAFNDAKTASEVLVPLAVKPEIHNAAVIDAEGASFATFGGPDMCPPPKPGDPAGVVDRGASWTIVEPVMLDGKRIGTFFMDADYASPRGDLQRLYLSVTGTVLAGSLLLVVLLTMKLQQFITRPIQLLASASDAVARDRDYSVRVDPRGNDELGLLTRAFNDMLGQIQSQDAALQEAQRALKDQVKVLQREVSERKRAEAALARLAAILEGTPDFVSSADLTGRIFYLNRAAREMVGLQPHTDITTMKISDFHPAWAGKLVSTEGLPGAIHEGSWAGESALLHRDGREIHVSQVIIAHKSANGGVEYFSTVVRDITERKEAEEALRISQQQLVETSRFAGMAEVATGVLHNVGNVLNSVNVSACLVLEKLRNSKAPKLSKAAALLTEKNGDLADYLTRDPNGQKLPGYLAKLGEFLVVENADILREVDQLGRNIEHIKEVVAMQQSYAKVSGVFENLPPERLVEDAIAMNIGAFERHGVILVRNFSAAPPVLVDRHKVLQILINLIRNAKYALDDAQRIDKRMTISIVPSGDEKVLIQVADNGIGISAENLTRIFGHGFTTKKDGHGFGLHSGANAAREIGGDLSVQSAGLGKGATFTLELPIAPANSHA